MRPFPYPQKKEFQIFKRLNTPAKVQNFINRIPINFELKGETCYSPLMVLREQKAHCMEGALLAASIFWYHGIRPRVMNLKTADGDEDHALAVFQNGNRWGAITKSNHAVLRYRDPVFRNVRELVMSYFNEYFLDNGMKTLRSYSAPFDMLKFGDEWLISQENLWKINDAINLSRHFEILPPGATRRLRPADPLEIEAGKLVEWKKTTGEESSASVS